MRIESVHFKNLNSLKGEWSIDLTHDIYRQTGIFAITGPTGAGKTTILDAVALALYGETPRLATISKSENEIMTRGAGEALAEVTFQAGGKRCRARWEQRRARKKPEGALQTAEVTLWEMTPEGGWQELAAQKHSFNAEIERLTGMKFEQFQRTMLLAQGNFAAFLKAESDDRAAMLEHITGTEIYSEISKAVHERFVKEKDQQSLLQTQLAASGTMTDEERQVVQAELKAKSEEAARLAAEHEAQKKILTQHEQAAEFASKLEKNAADLAQVEAQQAALAPLAQQLDNARRAQTLSEAAARVKTAREAVDKLAAEAPLLAARLAAARQEAATASAAQNASLQKKETAQKAYEALIAQTPQVRELDRQLPKLSEDAKKKTAAATEAAAREKKLAATLQKTEADRNKTQSEAARLRALQEKAQGDATIADQLPAVSAALARWDAAATNAAAARKKQIAAQKKLTTLEKSAAALAPDLEKATAARMTAQQALQAAQARCAEALAGETTASLRTKASSLAAREASLKALISDAERLSQAQARIVADRETLHKTEAEKAALDVQKKDAESAADLCQKAQESLQAQIDALTAVERLKEFRSHLEDGTPCPLCGALHHPFTEHRPDTDVTGPSVRLKEEKAKAKTLAKTLKTLTEKSAEAAAQAKTLTASLTDAVPAAQKAAAELAAQAKALALPDQDFGHAAPLERDKTAAETATIEKRLAQAAAASDEAALGQKQLEAESARLQALTERRATLAAQIEAQQAERDATAGDVKALDAALMQESAAFNDLIRAFSLPASTAGDARQLTDELARRAKAFAQNTEALRNLAAEDERLAEAHRQMTARLADARTQLASDRTAAADAQKTLDEKTAERRALFGEKSPDTEEKAADTARKAATAAFEKAQDAHQKAQQALTRADGIVLRNKEEMAAARKTQEAAEPVWLAALQAKGFASEIDWQAAVMTPDAVAAAESQINAAASRITQLKAVHDTLARSQAEVAQALLNAAPVSEVKARVTELAAARSAADKAAGASAERLRRDEEQLKKNEALAVQLAHQNDITNLWSKMKDLIGSADGKKYREFVQGLTFEHLLELANASLVKLTDRYELKADDHSPLSINVLDHYRAGNERSAKNLSGGETFIVSLALALGLSRLSGRNVHVDSLFLDEGFGTLDEAALDAALSVLASLNSEGKLIGIISHVGQIKERIPARIEVTPQSGGVSTLSGPGVTALG